MDKNSQTNIIGEKSGRARPKPNVVALAIALVLLLGALAFVLLRNFPSAFGNAADPKSGGGGGKHGPHSTAHRNAAFAANSEVRAVDVASSTITVYTLTGSFSANDIKFTEATLAVDPDATVIVNNNQSVQLADVPVGSHAYIFGKDVDGVFTVSKIIVQ